MEWMLWDFIKLHKISIEFHLEILFLVMYNISEQMFGKRGYSCICLQIAVRYQMGDDSHLCRWQAASMDSNELGMVGQKVTIKRFYLDSVSSGTENWVEDTTYTSPVSVTDSNGEYNN